MFRAMISSPHPYVVACLAIGCSVDVPEREAPTAAHRPLLEVAEQHESTPSDVARDIDVALVAQAKGWTFEQALADRLAADAVGEAAERLARMKPEAFVGSIVADEPGAPPTLLVKGVADDSIVSMVAAVEREKKVTIGIQDEQPFSFDELEERQVRVHGALAALGFTEIAVGTVNGRGEKILVVVGGKQDAVAVDMLSMIPADLRSAVEIQAVDGDVVREQAVFGGMNARDDGASECTFGWVVGNLSGGGGSPIWGITTAGHCSGINQALFPGGGTEAVAQQAQHIGAWGDLEWHAPTYIPLYEFRAGPSDYRDTLEVEALASLSVGESVCQYAPPPQQNVRDCSAEVSVTSFSCGTTQRLVVMNAGITEGGDSGSGWSFNNRAYGSHVGLCFINNVWLSVYTNADRFDDALNIVVATQ